jgi:2-methylcitrate dehydratase PrpD
MRTASPTLSDGLAAFVARLELATMPPDVVEKARACMLNGYGIGLGCHNTPYAPVARKVALALEGEQSRGATLLGDGRRTGIAGAALANAALFHGRAQEDTCGAAHLGAVIIPMLTALTEGRELPVERLLPALVAGYEAGGLLEQAYSGNTTPAGLRASPLYGTIAAAAASAKLLDLGERQIAAALANAAAFAGGTLQSFEDGTDEWRYQVGVAGRIGMLATELARAGSVSAPHAFEGRSGYVRAYARAECDVSDLLSRLGQEWAVKRVTFKPFPVCAFNQTPVTAALALREEINGRAIQRVRVRMNPYEVGYAGMDSRGPFSTISGTLMSIPFCIAVSLARGTPTMATMTDYQDAATSALMHKIDVVADAGVPKLSAIIEVDLAGGERAIREQRMTFADYSYDLAAVSKLIRRIGRETGVPDAAYDRLEGFVERLPDGKIADVIECFAMLPRRNQAAA